jgi:hypothetical protein
VGANLMRRLELSGTAWVPVLRSNRVDLDPLYFGVYGDAIYHHGAGFRAGELSPVHRSGAPAPLTAGRGVPGPVARVLGAVRWRHWERAATRARVRQSEAMYAKIASGRQEWLRELI